MINRVLIRIKVIQILYSFLLVEKQFTLESMPSAPTKEKRFAYSLYLDMLVLMARLAERMAQGRAVADKSLENTRFVRRLRIDDTIKAMLLQRGDEANPFESAIDSLEEALRASAIYKRYKEDIKKSPDSYDEHLWSDIFNFIIMASPAVNGIIETRTNFTLKGVERMKDMMGRTFRNFMASQDNVREVEKALDKSLDKARELYFRLLSLPIELTHLQSVILDDNRYKFIKSDEDRNPNMRFVDNRLVQALAADEVLQNNLENYKISWAAEDPVLLRALLTAITESDVYKEYMASEENDFKADEEVWRNIFKHVILTNPSFLEALEDKSVFWNDDLDIISTFVLKSLRRAEEDSSGSAATVVLEQFKDEEDARFGSELIRCVYNNKETYRTYIDEALKTGKWDTERVAFMDMVILLTALAEILNYPKIPLVVSLNEYIEIAKSYSSGKSGSFVNGVLAVVIAQLRQEKLLLK